MPEALDLRKVGALEFDFDDSEALEVLNFAYFKKGLEYTTFQNVPLPNYDTLNWLCGTLQKKANEYSTD